MTTEEVLPAAQDVADAFAAQYYSVLRNAPEQAHKVYSEDSVVNRPRPDGTMMSYKSIKAINDQILSCDDKGAEFEIASIDGQNSAGNGVFVVALGSITREDKTKKIKFSQTFFLAKQERAYVVLNDVLRYVDNEPSTADLKPVNGTTEPADAPAENKAVHSIEVSVKNTKIVEISLNSDHASSRKAEHVDAVVGNSVVDHACNGKADRVEITVKSAANGEGNSSKDHASNGNTNHFEVSIKNAANCESNSKTAQTSSGKAEDVEVIVEKIARASCGMVEIVEAIGENTANNGKDFKEKIAQPDASTAVTESQPWTTKQSFKSIVQSLAQNSAPFQVKAPIYKPRSPASNGSASFVASEKNLDEPGTSIYVGNLPMTTRLSQLHEIFRKFGPIRENGIQIISNRDKGVCFGFVAFVHAKTAQDLLQVAKTSSFTLAGRKLCVNEKLAKIGGGSSKPSGAVVSFPNKDQSAANGKYGRQ